MNSLIRKFTLPLIALIVAVVFLISIALITASNITYADTGNESQNGRLVTIYDRGTEKVILSKASTIGDALTEAGIFVDSRDLVEPAVDDKLVASDYRVNIYRSRPVLVVDGNIRQQIFTPYQTAQQIAKSAGIILYPEDNTILDRVDDLINGAGLQLTIDRATAFTFTLYGKTAVARSQAATVGGMLAEKGIKLGKDDRVSISQDTQLIEGLAVRVWREGKQTITVDEPVDFKIERIQDADREIGYHQIVTPGEKGSRSVTYEVIIQDGDEVSRKEIASLTVKQYQKQVEVVGAKLTFDGDFGAALVKLRACESGGNYANKNNPLYRGAYQFSYNTWANKYGIYDPADASPAQQDQAARDTYVRRGWQPCPVCGAAVLPDVYR